MDLSDQIAMTAYSQVYLYDKWNFNTLYFLEF